MLPCWLLWCVQEISKSNVVDDMVMSNPLLYAENEHPDHVVVIKYVPYVGDSKRAMDEYTSEIFMGGTNTIVMHNTCEDSLLATPLIFDLVILTEMAERIRIKKEGEEDYEPFHVVSPCSLADQHAPSTQHHSNWLRHGAVSGL